MPQPTEQDKGELGATHDAAKQGYFNPRRLIHPRTVRASVVLASRKSREEREDRCSVVPLLGLCDVARRLILIRALKRAAYVGTEPGSRAKGILGAPAGSPLADAPGNAAQCASAVSSNPTHDPQAPMLGPQKRSRASWPTPIRVGNQRAPADCWRRSSRAISRFWRTEGSFGRSCKLAS
jgi:hypothetical protein